MPLTCGDWDFVPTGQLVPTSMVNFQFLDPTKICKHVQTHTSKKLKTLYVKSSSERVQCRRGNASHFFPPTFNDQDQIYKMIYRVLQSKKNEYLENVIIYTSAKMFQF